MAIIDFRNEQMPDYSGSASPERLIASWNAQQARTHETARLD